MAESFAEQWRRLAHKMANRTKELHQAVVEDVRGSVVEGSPVTGAPGQPVQSGTLKGSWRVVPESEWVAILGTKLIYAPFIEDGVRPFHRRWGEAALGLSGASGAILTLRSPVGGFHSVKLTEAGFEKLVAVALTRLTGEAAA